MFCIGSSNLGGVFGVCVVGGVVEVGGVVVFGVVGFVIGVVVIVDGVFGSVLVIGLFILWCSY